MQIKLIWVGKTTESFIQAGIDEYAGRIPHYNRFSMVELKAGKTAEAREKEGEDILKNIDSSDIVLLLDEKGKERTSVEFADFLAHHRNISTKTIVFVIGGAYGFSEAVYKRANAKMALSKMTFPHQLVRVVFLEQLYRAFTILKGEKYHH